MLFKNDLHLRYFDTAEEFFELADWFLKHENASKKIDGYILDLIEKGAYKAP